MKFTAGMYISSAAINLAPFKNLNVTLNQINTTTNIQNGAPSLVLDDVAIETCNFEEIVKVIREFPSFKILTGGFIPELKVSVTDDNDKAINYNGHVPVVAL